MYSLEFTETAKKFLKKISKRDAGIIIDKISSLKDNPFRFLKRLQGEKLWRLRIMDYRAVADVYISLSKIIIIRVGHRKNIYDVL